MTDTKVRTRDSFNPIDIVHYIDKVLFISHLSIAEQRRRIPEAELLEHCVPILPFRDAPYPKLVAPHEGETGRSTLWFTKVEATVCNDYFIDVIRHHDAGVLSKIEIAQDMIFSTMAEAQAYGDWFENNVQRRNKHHKKHFHIEKEVRTFYLGKNRGEPASNYVRSYARLSKVQEVKGLPCYHIEFVLNGAQTVKRALNIQRDKDTGCYRELRPAGEMFNLLENRYLQYRTEGEPECRAFTTPKKIPWGSLYITGEEYKRIAV